MMPIDRATTLLSPLLALWLMAGCSATVLRPPAPVEDPRAAAIRDVAMHACDLIRLESPGEIDTLRETMAALNVLLRDQKADWGVISATFDAIPARSKRHLGLSAAMARQYADSTGGYYAGLRRLTSGCLNALTVGTPGQRSRETGRQGPPPPQSFRARTAAR